MIETTYQLPEATDLSRADISAIAESVAVKVGYTPGDPLEPVIAKLGGSVRYEALDDDSGSIVIDSDGFVISLPLETGLLRDRFTIAHELGHYVLHFLYQNQRNGRRITALRARRYGTGKVEIEANWFAAGFLMPADLFRKKYDELGASQHLVADYFKVSPQAAAVRALSLKLT